MEASSKAHHLPMISPLRWSWQDYNRLKMGIGRSSRHQHDDEKGPAVCHQQIPVVQGQGLSMWTGPAFDVPQIRYKNPWKAASFSPPRSRGPLLSISFPSLGAFRPGSLQSSRYCPLHQAVANYQFAFFVFFLSSQSTSWVERSSRNTMFLTSLLRLMSNWPASSGACHLALLSTHYSRPASRPSRHIGGQGR